MANKEEMQKCNLTVKGTIMYPKFENGVHSYAIVIDAKTAGAVHKEVKKETGLDCKFSEINGEYVINVKSKYSVPVYDFATKERLEDDNGNPIRVNHGARGYVAISYKEYTYMKKSGVTAYVTGFILEENGEPAKRSTDFMSIMAGTVL